MVDVRPTKDAEEFEQALLAIGHYFGMEAGSEDAQRFARNLPVERTHAAYEDGSIVGGAGAFPFVFSVPGGSVRCAGVTIVGVYPTHRRRGVLRSMMRAQIDDVHERGEPIAILWASEGNIYQRFGYGLGSLRMGINLARDRGEHAARQAGCRREARPDDGDCR